MFKKFFHFITLIFFGAIDFVRNGVKPAVEAVKQFSAAIGDSNLDVVTLLTQNCKMPKAGIAQLAVVIRKCASAKLLDLEKIDASNEDFLKVFVTKLREKSDATQRIVLFDIACEYAVALVPESKLMAYQVMTLVQLWYATRKENCRIPEKLN